MATSTVILTLASVVNGQRVGHCSDVDIRDAINRFGHADSVERQDDDAGTRFLVVCPTQRGATGGSTLHAIACALRIPVHVL